MKKTIGINVSVKTWTTLAATVAGLAFSTLLSPCLQAAEQVLSPELQITSSELLPTNSTSLLRLGPFDIHPRVSGGVIYDDNILIRNAGRLEDVIWTISPGIAAVAGFQQGGEGKMLTIDYSPSFNFYTRHSDNNSIDHHARLTALWPITKLTLTLSQEFTSSSGSVVEVGDRVHQKTYVTAFNGHYDVSEKTSVDVGLHQTISDYERFISSREWYNDDWLNYQVLPKINMGVGLTLGYLEQDSSPHQTYEKLLVRAVYVLTGKIDLTASAGGELRQYGASAGDRLAPVFSLGVTYRPTDTTTISLEAHRQQQNSILFIGENYYTTGFTVAIRQRVAERLFLTVGGGYDNADYVSAQKGITANREDNFYSARVSLDASLTPRWTAGVFYQYRKNESNLGVFGYDSNQVGVQTAWGF